jgi:hypothetical protein
VLKDQSAFFRKGTSGSSNEVLTPADRERYRSRLAELAPGDLIEWLHAGR